MTGYYLHYIRYGRKEHRHTTGCTEILGGLTSSEGKDYSAVYNYGYYVSRYADLWAVFHYDEQGALNHFLTYGMIAFASSFPGEIRALTLAPGRDIIVQKRAFLAGEAGVNLSVFFQKKLGSGFFGGEGFIMG